MYCLSFCSRSTHSTSLNLGRRYHYKVIADDLILAVGLKDGRIRLWNIKTGELTGNYFAKVSMEHFGVGFCTGKNFLTTL